MNNRDKPIILNSQLFAGEGTSRYIYHHPDNPDFLIKISKFVMDSDKQKISYRNYHRYFKYLTSEIAEYARLRLYPYSSTHMIQQIIGFANTNLGMGLIVKAEKDKDGTLAPTLGYLIENSLLHGSARHHFELFLQQLSQIDICVSELTLQNIVYAHSSDHGNYFVLIDGTEDNCFIPLGFYSKFCRTSRRKKKIRNLRIQVYSLIEKNAS